MRGLEIQVRVGRESTARDTLASDWVLVHEMVHLALPEVGRSAQLAGRGAGSLMSKASRARNSAIAKSPTFGPRIADPMPMGLPRAGEGGMDQSRSQGTYLLGRRTVLSAGGCGDTRTNGQPSRAANGVARHLERDRGLRLRQRHRGCSSNRRRGHGDARDLQASTSQIRAAPVTPDLDLLWTLLGVPNDPKTQPFDDRAPLAAIRIAITAPQPSGQPGTSVPKN